MLPPLVLPAAGSHGAERRGADGRVTRNPDGQALLDAAAERIGAFANDTGLLVERKAGAVTLRYRSHPETAGACRDLIDGLAFAQSGLRALHGDMVSELALPDAHKGRALDAFMAEPPFRGRTPVAVGDDTTDEDALAAAQALRGIGILIGPGVTVATIRMPDIDSFLDRLHAAAEQHAGGAWISD